jgi:protein gp37
MAETTTIEWTRNDDGSPGRTWNPVTGCTKISSGCDNCYAETIAERFRGHAAFPHGFDVQIRADKVNDPLTWRKPTRVFVNSMSDLFHDEINQEWIAEIFGVMAAARRHTFQLLTKRHARMRHLLNDPAFIHKIRHRAQGKGLSIPDFTWPLPNLWLGVSVENQQWADIRIPALLRTPAAVKFLSCEPLLGPVDLTRIPFKGDRDYVIDSLAGRYGIREPKDAFNFGMASLSPISWVIVGGESGRKARPMAPQWATSLRDQCEAARVPFFFKQWGEYAPTGYLVIGGTSKGTLLAGDPVDDLGHRAELARVGKKQAGRLLDGREHNAFPAVAA